MSPPPGPSGLLLDVGHTLLRPVRPVGQLYAEVAARHGLRRDPDAVDRAFRRAFRASTPPGRLRYEGDGRPFWRAVVAASLHTDSRAIFEDLYGFFGQPEAWVLREGAVEALAELREGGVGIALVSDWDTRLRPLLTRMGLLARVDHLSVSCEVGAEKPDPAIFLDACAALGRPPGDTLHLGDDPLRDARGARLVGCRAWTWGEDLQDFRELPRRFAQLRA